SAHEVVLSESGIGADRGQDLLGKRLIDVRLSELIYRAAHLCVAREDGIEDGCESVRNRVIVRCAMLRRVRGDVCRETAERPGAALSRQVQFTYELQIELESFDLGTVARERQGEDFLSSAAARDHDEEARVLEHHPRVETCRCDGFAEPGKRRLRLGGLVAESAKILEDGLRRAVLFLQRRVLAALCGLAAPEPGRADPCAAALAHRHSPFVSMMIFSARRSRSSCLKGS